MRAVATVWLVSTVRPWAEWTVRGVAERDVLGHIGGGQVPSRAELVPVAGAAAKERGDDEAAVVVGFEDPVLLAVDRAAPVAVRGRPGASRCSRAWTRSPTPARVPSQAERHTVLGDRPSRTSSARTCADTRAACSLVSVMSRLCRPARVSPR